LLGNKTENEIIIATGFKPRKKIRETVMTTHFDVKMRKRGVKSEIFESFEFVVREPERHIVATLAMREKIIKSLDEQIKMASNRGYQPMKYKWLADVNGNIRKTAVPIKLKKWWVQLLDGRVQISVFYKGKPVEMKDGRNAIRIESIKELVAHLELLRASVNLGDFDDLIYQ